MRFLFLLWYCLVNHFNNNIQFLLKLVWFDGINLFVISSIFLLMKQVLLKTIVIVVSKLTRSSILQGGAGLCRAQGAGMGQENFSCHAEQGRDRVRQNHVGQGKRPHLSDSLCPITIPTLYLFRSSLPLTSLLFFSHRSLFPTCPDLLSLTHSFHLSLSSL